MLYSIVIKTYSRFNYIFSSNYLSLVGSSESIESENSIYTHIIINEQYRTYKCIQTLIDHYINSIITATSICIIGINMITIIQRICDYMGWFLY